MITKEEFSNFLNEFKSFENKIERIELAVSGKKYGLSLFECDWYESVDRMLYIFLNSHFTELGVDWISYYLFEDVEDHLVTVTISADLFNKEHEIEYHLDSIDELWDFLMTDKKLYFKNAE